MLTCPINQGVDQVQTILSAFELLHLNWWRSNSGLQGLLNIDQMHSQQQQQAFEKEQW